MPHPARVVLGASTTTRSWYVDCNTGTTAVPIWTPVGGISDFKPSRDGSMEDDSDFDSGGYQSETKTAEKWGADLKLVRKVTAASSTAYDPGQEFLRAKSEGTFGVANSAEIRYYEMETGGPRIQAYQGRCAVGWSEDGGGMTSLRTATVKMSGQGRLNSIVHPGTT